MACSAARGVVTQQCTRRPSVLSPALLNAVAPAAVKLVMTGQQQLLRVTLERQALDKST